MSRQETGGAAEDGGRDPESARARGGASDASHFAPTIALTVDGLGPRGGGAHTPEEFIYADSVRERIALALAVAIAVSSGAAALEAAARDGELDDLLARRDDARAQGRYYGIGFAAVVEPSVSNMGYITTALTAEERHRAGLKNGAQSTATINLDHSLRHNLITIAITLLVTVTLLLRNVNPALLILVGGAVGWFALRMM